MKGPDARLLASADFDHSGEIDLDEFIYPVKLNAGEDIGAAVVYLASKEAGYVTGQTLHVNGGMAMI